MYYSIFPTYDATIYEKHDDRNTGIDEILELSKIAENTVDPEYNYWENSFNSRILIKFDIDALNTLITNGTVANTNKYYLVLKATEATDLPVDYTIKAYPVSQSWDNGNGSYNDYPEIKTGVSWIYRDGWLNGTGKKWVSGSYTAGTTGSYITTSGGGTWYTGSGFEASQSFDYVDPDLRMDVTDIVVKWLSSSIDNNGFIIKRSDADEFSTSIMGSIKYFSRDTHTIFVPRLEIMWDASDYSGTGSFTEIGSTTDFTLFFNNIKSSYKEAEKTKIRLVARDRFPTKTFSTASSYLSTKRLPTSSYYSVIDSGTDETIIPFDDDYTKISIDTTGNYFKLNMNSFLPERYYKIIVKVVQEGGSIERIMDDGFYFKVVR